MRQTKAFRCVQANQALKLKEREAQHVQDVLVDAACAGAGHELVSSEGSAREASRSRACRLVVMMRSAQRKRTSTGEKSAAGRLL
jgi:hypothetical protein